MNSKDLSRRKFLKVGTAGGFLAAAVGPGCARRQGLLPVEIDSPLGKHAIDSAGTPVGVVRLDVEKSYQGIGDLLQKVINDADKAAWAAIKSKIDYTYNSLDFALGSLEVETGLGRKIHDRLKQGQKLLFKPNLVGMTHIDPQTHGPGTAYKTNTEWAFVAALMRWFHDKLDVRYRQMAVGEASTCMPMVAGMYSMMNASGKRITPEAAIEGRSGDFYGGWGFYFARRYLSETLPPGSREDPIRGYEESAAGVYIPPGHSDDRLMVYDLNQIHGEEPRGREVPVTDGVNYRSVILHKAIVGGKRGDSRDMEAYPGCILVNVPKYKVHAITLFTNAIKNLGIGLYPMHAGDNASKSWNYSLPHGTIPGIKGGIPHQVWVLQMDPKTGTPLRDNEGRYQVRKTGGITATMIDIIKAVQDQDVMMLHVVDGIEAINYDHTGPGEKVAEGMVFAGLDPVATDLLCARYMFGNVQLEEAIKVDMDDGTGARFPQRVPLPVVENGQIVTKTSYDCPLGRDVCLRRAEERGLGRRKYYVVGRDLTADAQLVSLAGHLGRVKERKFSDLITSTLYFDFSKMPWDLQKTTLAYFDCVDRLKSTRVKDEFLTAFDEDGDGVVTYEDFGRRGEIGPAIFHLGRRIATAGTERLGLQKGVFIASATLIKHRNPAWNPDRHDLLRPFSYLAAAGTAYRMSQAETENDDPFARALSWGQGKWPSYELALHSSLLASFYGARYPQEIDPQSLYGLALAYADLTQNQGRLSSASGGIGSYVRAVPRGEAKRLDFVLYVPKDYAVIRGFALPNVEETSDPGRILTASFAGGKEVWA